MSTMTTINLRLKFNKDLPEEIVKWFEINLDTEAVEADDYESYIPPYILNNAQRCGWLHVSGDVGTEYAFYKDTDNWTLELLYAHKNKDDDFERFINFLMPFIIRDESLGFIANDYSDSVYKILFKDSPDATKIVKVILHPGMCDGYTNEERYIDIDGDIDWLESMYQEGIRNNP